MDRDYEGRRVTVMGLGTFGGGVGVVRFLAERGAQVLVTDLKSEQVLHESLQALKDLQNLRFRLGEHDAQDFRDTDLVVVNPGVDPRNAFVAVARDAGVPLTTEISLFWTHNRGRVVAITGSNGKSTTTALTHTLIAASGQTCWLGGNIGKSLLPDVERIADDDWVVLELSSFQLEWLNAIQARPEIAIVTNFSANHLDWHLTLDDYRQAKQTILRWQRTSDWSVLNADDADVRQWPTAGRRFHFGTGCSTASRCEVAGTELHLDSDASQWVIDLADCFSLLGPHNRMNAAAAVSAAHAAGVSQEDVVRGLAEFRSLPHRLELVASARGRDFYNDSIATTPESAMCGLNSFNRPLVLLAGGYDKHVDLSEFARAIARQTKAVALMGQTATALAEVVSQSRQGERPAVHLATSLQDAFQWCVAQASAGDVVLLSPGCASYDWFRNFVDRGDQFAELARTWCDS